MSLAQALSTYATLNLLILLGATATLLAARLFPRREFGTLLRLNYAALALVFAVTFVQPLLPKHQVFEPAAKVWSAHSIKSFSDDLHFADSGGYLTVPGTGGRTVVGADRIATIWIALAAALALFGGAFLWRDLGALFRIRRAAFLIRRIGRVHVYSHEGIDVPFSFWTPGRASVVLPERLLGHPTDFRIALAHEIQHHRQRDTLWVYAIWFLRLVCVVNPLVSLWAKRISELQEFACDEALLGQGKVDSRSYARCLFEVAESAFHQGRAPACATGLTFLVERNLVQRRIETMLNTSKKTKSTTLVTAFCAALALAMASTAFAAKTLVQDRRVTMKQAEEMARIARQSSEFPVEVNDLVLAQLNRFIGTPEGRDYMREALVRKENYRALVDGKIEEYGVPAELAAIPIIESRYENLPDRNQRGYGAGLWMFIVSTAKMYGLRVDHQVDERLNENLETDAAMRYLKSNQLRFKDWQLAVLAYNMGEGAVGEAIRATGSRDAWTLVRAGYEGDKAYLAKVMAAILIMKNPDSVK